jgi:autotransporter-associated beta strand protein
MGKARAKQKPTKYSMKTPTSKPGRIVKIGALTLTTLFAFSMFTVKADIEWQGGTDSYTNPVDWAGGVVPGASTNADNSNGSGNVVQIAAGNPDWTIIDITAGGQPNASGAIEQNGPALNVNGWLHIGAGSNSFGIFTLDSGTINVPNGALFLGEGQGSTSVLNINNGTINKGNTPANPFYIGVGNWNGSYARTGTVNQVNGTVNSTSEIWIGQAALGTGIYNLHGGSINSSNWFVVGRGGATGTLNMDGGVITEFSGGQPAFIISDGSVGTMNQSAGTINTASSEFWIANSGGSIGTNNMSGTAVLNVNNWLAVGRGGSAVLNISGGSINKTGGGNITIAGNGSTSTTGTINQTGGSITNTTSQTWIGETGIGVWNMENGTNILGQVIIASTTSANGTLNLDGGLFQATGISAAGSPAFSTLNFNGGMLQAGAANANFVSGLLQAQVGPGGVVINSQTYGVTIPQALTDNGGGGLTKYGTGVLTLSGANTFTGPTVVNAGKVITTTASSGSGNISVASSAGFGVTVANAQNTQFITPSLTFASSTATLDIDLSSFGNPSYPSSAPLKVTALTNNAAVTVNIAAAVPAAGQIPLLQYSGTIAGSGTFLLGALPSGSVGYLSNNVLNSSIDLVITSAGAPRWDGSVAGGVWDINNTPNWYDLGTMTISTYHDGTPVLFDDNATGTTNVNLVTTVTPASIKVTNNVLGYILTGTGKISGSGGLTKQGINSLVLENTGGNNFTGPVTISGGTLIVTNLANGGSPSAIGASSASPTNLVLAGGMFSYAGSSVTINRGYQMTASSTITNSGNLTLTGLAQATAGAYVKLGSATLTYAGVGTNVLSITGGSFSAQVLNGTMVLDGSAGGQTNTEGGEMYVGSGGAGTNSGANLILTNSTLNCNTWFAIARGNGTSGFTSTASLYNSTLTCPGGLSLCYANGLSGYLANAVLNLSGNSQLIDGGAANICENNGGGNATVNVTGSSSLIANGTVYIGNTLSKGVLNLNSTGTNTLGNNSGGQVFRVGGGANSGDTGVGAINQSSGTLISGSNSVYLAVGIGGGAGCYGSINLSGGTFNRPNFGMRVGRSGLASFVQSGGTFICGGEFSMSSSAGFGNGVAAATFTGGSATINSGNGFRVPEASSFSAAVNIGTEAGGNASVVTLFSSGFQLCYGAAAGSGTLNLDSGTLQLGGPISKNGGAGTATVNLNGGTVQAGVSTVTLIDGTPSSVNVYKGGLTVDTMGNTATVSGNLLTTAGNGIYPAGGILLVTTNGGAGYIGAPLVTVTTSGSGSGTMAIATVTGGVMTNVVITSPGKNYSAGDTVTFAFSGGGPTSVASNFVYILQAGDLAANSSGGLTKVGTGTLYLNGTSTYTGTTAVSNGTLGGSGTIAGPVTIASGATLTAGAGSIGTLTINNSLTFAAGSTNLMKITPSSNDQIAGLNGVTYGGALVVTNTGGALSVGHVYQLFNASGSINGNFNSVTVLPSGSYTGTFNPATGQLTIGSAASAVVNTPFLSGGNLILTGSGGTPGAGYTWLTTTNITNPVATWTTNSTGTFSLSGTFSNAIPVNFSSPAQFFRLRTP